MSYNGFDAYQISNWRCQGGERGDINQKQGHQHRAEP